MWTGKNIQTNVVNNTASDMVNVSLLLNLPANAYYTANSITGTLPITESNISDLNQPLLEIPNLLINSSLSNELNSFIITVNFSYHI